MRRADRQLKVHMTRRSSEVSGGGAVSSFSARKRLPKATNKEAVRDNDREFDGWLDGQLRSLYDSVLHEPVPEDMLELLKRKPRTR